MKRRDFITSSTIATAGLGSALVVSCNSTDKPVKAEAAFADGIPAFELLMRMSMPRRTVCRRNLKRRFYHKTLNFFYENKSNHNRRFGHGR